MVTRKNFNPAGMSTKEIEDMKLEDGIHLHESVKVELGTYACETGQPYVKPFMLVIARDTTHAGQLMKFIQSDLFFKGQYRDKVIQVDSSRTGKAEDEMIERLLKVEHTDEPTEVVIHVNMLKEGWDVTNLYTIVPLRAANARVLIEQSIGRGLRLPYGKRTGVTAVDRLNIVAHDKFQEIVDEANKPDSAIRLQVYEMDPDELSRKTMTVVSQSQLSHALGLQPEHSTPSMVIPETADPAAFADPHAQEVAQLTRTVIQKYQNQPQTVPSVTYLKKPDIHARLVKDVKQQYGPKQMEFEGLSEQPDIEAIVAKTSDLVIQRTIDIPRILVIPKGTVRSGFKSFTLDLSALRYPEPSEELWIQHLRTHQFETLSLGKAGIQERCLEDYVVGGLIDFDDICYDEQADQLYELAGQVVNHLRSYLEDDQIHKVLRCHQREITRLVHLQMQDHYWEEAADYEVKVHKGFVDLKESAYTTTEPPTDFHQAPDSKSSIATVLFCGFQRCLFPVQKFDSDTERKLAVILDRDAIKWLRPARGQLHMYYKSGADHLEYQPDFVAETETAIYMLESKARKDMNNSDVIAKRDIAVKWCRQASDYATSYGGKPWSYVLIPHDDIAVNNTLDSLVQQSTTQ